MREYDEKRREAECLKEQIESNEIGDNNYISEIKLLYDKWFPEISKVIMTINSHFSDFMQSMGYVGEIKLIRKDEV